MAELQTTTIQVTFKDESQKFLQAEEGNINEALAKMGATINALAQLYAPVLTGALRADGRVRLAPNSVTVTFGGYSVPYARRRHYENNLHPDTKYYLERAGDQVAREGITKYL